MTASVIRIIAATMLAAALTLTLSCGGGREGTVDELFASAQDFQKEEKFDDAIKVYRRVIREHPDTRQGANSQFMIGYIYANHLKDFEQARIELNRFLENYSETADSGLVVGAKFELQFMGKDIEEIPILSELGEVDTLAAEDTEGP